MKRILLVLIMCSVPALMFLNAWQVYRFNTALKEVRLLEEKQRELIEENKNTLVGIEVLSSPSRIDGLAKEIEGIEKSTDAPRVLVQIGAGEAGE